MSKSNSDTVNAIAIRLLGQYRQGEDVSMDDILNIMEEVLREAATRDPELMDVFEAHLPRFDDE